MTADSAGQPGVVLFTRVGCHLCEDAATQLEGLARELGFGWRAVDIDRDAALLARYDWLVPVVALDGVELVHAPIEPAILRERLRAALLRAAH